MAQIKTKFLSDGSVTSGTLAAHGKIGSGAAASTSALFSDGSGGTAFRAIASGDVTGISISGSQVTGGTFGAVNGSALTNLSAAALSGVLPVGVTGGSGLSIATSQITGVLPIANGGTDNGSLPVTAGGVFYSDGTKFQNTGAGTSGQVLTSNGASAPTWTAASSGTVTTVSVVSTNGFAGTVANATSTPAITIETTLNTPVIAGNGTAIIAATTTGTGSTVVLSASPTFTGTVTTAALSATSGSFSSAVNMNSNQINNLATPTSATDAATKGYVDSAIAGLTWQGPAQAYADSNVLLTGGATLTIDGYSVQNGDLVILGHQTVATTSGEYTASGIGTAYTLTSNGLPTQAGDAWLILNGTVYGDSAFVSNYAFGSSSTPMFTEFAGPTAYTFNAPLSLSGRTVSITQANTSTNGYLSSTDWNTFNNKLTSSLASGDIFVGSSGGTATARAMTGDINITNTGVTSIVATSNATITTLSALTTASSLASVGTITSGTWNGTTIAVAHGGTGQTSSLTAGGVIYGSSTTAMASTAAGTSGQVLTSNGSSAPTWSTPGYSSTATEDVLTLNSTDINTNQYKDLLNTATGTNAGTNSISLNVVGGPEQQKTVDYTVSLTGGVGGVTRITFAGDLATGGNAALVVGDILMVKYTY
jgi:trimeric autotransporter adhesin